jgi:hypothetical protein
MSDHPLSERLIRVLMPPVGVAIIVLGLYSVFSDSTTYRPLKNARETLESAVAPRSALSPYSQGINDVYHYCLKNNSRRISAILNNSALTSNPEFDAVLGIEESTSPNLYDRRLRVEEDQLDPPAARKPVNHTEDTSVSDIQALKDLISSGYMDPIIVAILQRRTVMTKSDIDGVVDGYCINRSSQPLGLGDDRDSDMMFIKRNLPPIAK